MNINIDYPAQTKTIRIDNIKLNLGTRKAMVEVWKDGYADSKEVDINLILDKATATQINTIKLFFKAIIAQILDLKVSDIPDTVFQVEVD